MYTATLRDLYGSRDISYSFRSLCGAVLVGPCHHGMARPQVADRGTASDKEGSCE
jgi:hypothetical protein